MELLTELYFKITKVWQQKTEDETWIQKDPGPFSSLPLIPTLFVRLPLEAAIPLLCICLKNSASESTDTCPATVIAALLTIGRKPKQSICPSSDGQIIETLHIQYGILFSRKEK